MFLKCARMIPGKPGIRGFPGGSVVKNPPASVGDTRVVGLIPVEKIPCSGKWLPTPVSLPGKFHGQRSLAGYGPWGHKESIRQSGWAHTHTHECRVSANNPLQWIPSTLAQNSYFSISSVAQSSPTLCDPVDCSVSGFPVHHWLPKLAPTHVHQVGDAIQPSHSLLSFSMTQAYNISWITWYLHL